MNRKWKNPCYNTEYAGLYQSWNNMLKRAGNKDGKNPTYSDVTVCKEWYDYDVFFEWAINNGWKPGLCIDKDILIPGNREYKPEACKWVSRVDNNKEMHNRVNFFSSNNKRSKKIRCIETGKIYDCCRDAERDLNLSKSSVRHAANPKHTQQTAGGYHWEFK